MSPPETTSQPGSGDLDGRPGRWGLFFVAIWTLFLIQPLATAWDQRDQLSGWVGMLGTLSFVAAYIAVFARRRMSMRSGQPCQPLGRALANLAVLAGLSLVVMLSIGQPGTATAVYLCVVCAMILPNPWAIPAALDFLLRNRETYPFHAVISHQFPLAEIDRAFAECEWAGRDASAVVRGVLVP